MSDLNDLIHTNAHRAYDQGVTRERERVIALLTEVKTTWRKPTSFNYQSELERLIDLIAADRG
jgi:hypothetical protein